MLTNTYPEKEQNQVGSGCGSTVKIVVVGGRFSLSRRTAYCVLAINL